MTIKQAKEQISRAVDAYLMRDEFGDLVIPTERQRPILLMGPPGIGKTAIMAQIAREKGIGFVSYAMTHHTRQSALGLPFIVHKTYGGRECDVSEYTMSEIIATVYDQIEQSGVREGILFLDEINCVSETLAPSMLQFLQFKTFGRHRVPEGWIVVTAGNPPEYNDSVREFDVVTWDRLRRIDVAPDLDAWRAYALTCGAHPAVLTYLDIKKEHFYSVENTVDGKRFVTARGWVDLSETIRLYEKRGFPVDETLIGQYLQHPAIARSFSVYYDLFKKYESDYQVERILAGQEDPEIEARARQAKFDERLTLLELMLDALGDDFRQIAVTEGMMAHLTDVLRALRPALEGLDSAAAAARLAAEATALEGTTHADRGPIRLSEEAIGAARRAARVMTEMAEDILKARAPSGGAAFKIVKARFEGEKGRLKAAASNTGARLERAFAFCERVFDEGQELLILVTELTVNPNAARFIGRYGSVGYARHNKELLFHERQTEIIKMIDDWSLEE